MLWQELRGETPDCPSSSLFLCPWEVTASKCERVRVCQALSQKFRTLLQVKCSLFLRLFIYLLFIRRNKTSLQLKYLWHWILRRKKMSKTYSCKAVCVGSSFLSFLLYRASVGRSGLFSCPFFCFVLCCVLRHQLTM